MSAKDIAIVGMAVRLPGAPNLERFWENLIGGVESIRELSEEELLAAGVSRRDISDPEYVRVCPVLEDFEKFDAAFFGMSPREASLMDPMHRFFLEVVWEALEHSGNTGLPDEGTVGVFAGSGAPYYLMDNVRTNEGLMNDVGEFLARHTGNDMNFLATRASYELDLRGPSLNIQTACSSALAAVHQARISLLGNECDIALAGASTIIQPMGHGYKYKEGEILSPDGHCRPFDHRSAGTVFGSGTGCFVMKRYQDAIDAGDTIYAVVKGSAVNNDGALKVGYLAPGVDMQVEVVKAALKNANVSAESISYVETHGTGTSVGDPIELTALAEALSSGSGRKQFCGVGSVKSNIGHLGEAAACASLAKTILSFRHQKIPATLGFERPNPQLNLEDGPLYVVGEAQEWVSEGPRRCGITALGAGGTNVHVILEEPPPPISGEGGRDVQLFCLSARSRSALDRQSELLASAFESNPNLDLPDAAYTLAVGRRALEYRRVFSASNAAQAIERLRSTDTKMLYTSVANLSSPGLVFTFPGGGAQYAGMGKGLYESEPAYREAMDECLATIDGLLDVDLRDLLFALPAQQAQATKQLERPSLSLPALFATEYALARMFEAWGLEPVAMVGHSMGEYVAACLAGVFSVQDGVRLVATRGQLFETTASGSMVAVSLSEGDARAMMPHGLSIAAVNAPELCVASGPTELIEQFKQQLGQADVDYTAIHIDVAAHSSMLESILASFRAFCQTIQFRPPMRPIASNLTGAWLTGEQAVDPEYWVQHLRNTVRFSDCMETVLARGPHVFLEIGPGRTLTTLANSQKSKVSHCISSIRHPKEDANDLEFALATFGKVWGSGAEVDWTAFYEDQLRNRISVPTYPFEKTPFLIQPGEQHRRAEGELRKRDNIDEWFYSTSWARSVAVSQGTPAVHWLIVGDDEGFSSALADALRSDGATLVSVVAKGKSLRRVARNAWRYDPQSVSHFREILEILDSEGALPQHTVFCSGLTAQSPQRLRDWIKSTTRYIQREHSDAEVAPDRMLEDYRAFINLAKALAAVCDHGQLSVATVGAFSLGNEDIDPKRRLLVGPSQVISREIPEFSGRFIDLRADSAEQLVASLVQELKSQSDDEVVLLRGAKRWVQQIVPVPLPSTVGLDVEGNNEGQDSAIPGNSIVVITGGLGGIGLVVAKHLATKPGMSLALLARTRMPHRSEWPSIVADPTSSPGLRARIDSVREVEATGARVMCLQADVTNLESVQRAAREIFQTWGSPQVLIHAAGVIEDAPFQTKSEESILRVLRPKVQGTENLEKTFGPQLQLMVLFSSVASFLGLPGQIDYAAANAFLDALAEKRSQVSSSCRTVVINWNAWRDVGMVVEGARAIELSPLRTSDTGHPWLQAVLRAGNEVSYLLDLSPQRDWILSEHRIEGGLSLIPGTGFVELMRAAFVESNGSSSVELTEVRFTTPFQVAPDQSRRLQIQLSGPPDDCSVSILSLPERAEHATAQIRRIPVEPSKAIDLSSIFERCQVQMQVREGGFLDQDFVAFGPRWGNLRSIRLGKAEALIELELAEEFKSELSKLAYHPAILDMATGGAQQLIPGFDQGQDFYVPFAYERVRIFGGATRRCFSHVRLDPSSSGELAIFDVSLVGSEGQLLVEIQGFTMKRARRDAAIVRSEVAPVEAPGGRVLEALLREAILPAEGLVAFDRVLKQPQLSQVIVSSVDVNLWRKQLGRKHPDESQSDDGSDAAFDRPDLGTEYVAPENSVEECLAGIWSKLLGIGDPGALDDFFELGGDSLIAVRFFARVKKQLGVSLPISTLFQAPTIRKLAKLLIDGGVEVDGGKRLEDPAKKKFVPFSTLEAGRKIRSIDVAPGLYRPIFQKTDSLPRLPNLEGGRCWLIFLDDIGLGRQIKQELLSLNDSVVLVRSGDGTARNSSTDYTLAPEKGRETYEFLLRELAKDGKLPTDILHMWLVTNDESFRVGSSFFHRTQEEGYLSLLALAQAIAQAELDVPLNLYCVTNGLGGSATRGRSVRIQDSKTTVCGILDCVPLELPKVSTRHIDLDLQTAEGGRDLGKQISDTFKRATNEEVAIKQMSGALINELFRKNTDQLVRLSPTERSIQEWVPAFTHKPPSRPLIPANSVYCLLGNPTPLVLEVMEQIVGNDLGTRCVWLRDQLSVKTDFKVDEDRLRKSGLELYVEDCDLTNLESVVASIKKHTNAEQSLSGAILCGRRSPRELMQLFEPGEAEEELSERVQSAHILTSSMRKLAPRAFVLLLGHEQNPTAMEGEAVGRSGNSFLAAHAEKCRREGQRVACLLESGVVTEGGSWPRELVASVVEHLLEPNGSGETLWAVSENASASPSLMMRDDIPPPSVVASQRGSEMEAALVPLFQAAVGDTSLHAHSILSDFDATRLTAARLATHLKNHYVLKQTVSNLLRYQSPAQFAALLENRIEEESSKPNYRHLVPMHSSQSGTRSPFFLVAGMFGNILNLRHLGRLLGADREVYGVQARGLYGDEKPHRTIEEMAEAYLAEIRQVVPDGPYFLGGYSGGGLVAFEMAKRLRAEGKEVPVLVLLDTPLPQRPEITYRDRLVMQRLKLQRGGARYLGKWARDRVSWELDLIRRRFHEIDETYSPGSFKYDAIQEAFLAAAAAYKVGSYAGRVIFYRPALDKAYEVAPGRFITSSRELVLDDQGWSSHVDAIEIHEVPGDHDHMVLEPEVRVLASLMRRRLAENDVPVLERINHLALDADFTPS